MSIFRLNINLVIKLESDKDFRKNVLEILNGLDLGIYITRNKTISIIYNYFICILSLECKMKKIKELTINETIN